MDERMLKWFEFKSFPEPLHDILLLFYQIAKATAYNEGHTTYVAPGPERTVMLRKLLEARDAAVRAALHPGG